MASVALNTLPGLMTLPHEILQRVLDYVFDSRIIVFPGQLNIRQDEYEGPYIRCWYLDILQTNHQIKAMAEPILRSAVSRSTLLVASSPVNRNAPSAPLRIDPTPSAPSAHDSRFCDEYLYSRRMLLSFISQYDPYVQRVHFKDFDSSYFDLLPLTGIQEVHVQHYCYNESIVPDSDPPVTFSDLACKGSDAQIRAASLSSWRALQSQFKQVSSSPHRDSVEELLLESYFWRLFKTRKWACRNFDIFLHVEHGPPEDAVTGKQHKLMEVTWKFADAPLEGDGMEVVRIERDWELIKRLYDNAYGQAESFGVTM